MNPIIQELTDDKQYIYLLAICHYVKKHGPALGYEPAVCQYFSEVAPFGVCNAIVYTIFLERLYSKMGSKCEYLARALITLKSRHCMATSSKPIISNRMGSFLSISQLAPKPLMMVPSSVLTVLKSI